MNLQNIAILNPPTETKCMPAKLHGTNTDDKLANGSSGRYDASHTLPADENTEVIERSPSPAREWIAGEEYDSDEYEVVEVEVTDSEEESESETLRDSSKLGNDEKCSSTRVEDGNKDDRCNVSVRLTSPKYNTSSGASSPYGTSDTVTPQRLCLDTQWKRASDSDRSNPQSPNSPRCTPTSPFSSGKAHGVGETQGSAISPPPSTRSSSYPATALGSSARRSTVDMDVKPEALTKINSFFNFK